MSHHQTVPAWSSQTTWETWTGAPLSIITSPSSRATQPSCLKFTSLISFSSVNTCSFPGSALTFSRSLLRPRSPSCRGWLVTNSLVRNYPSFRTCSTLCRCQVYRCFCFCFCFCLCFCFGCGLCSCLCSCPCRCLCCRLCCSLFCYF